MSAPKHTAGPWEASEIAPEDPAWGACEIWPVNGDEPVATMVCGLSNARLIAAAPDLLEALTIAAERFEALASGCYALGYDATGESSEKHAAEARAIIAKATGAAQ